MDHVGLTALDYARRRLVKLRPGPDPVQRSRSLDRHGNLRLSQEERDMLDEVKRTAKEPALAAEVADVYILERRKAALRQFMPRRELRFIIDQLEEIACEG